MIGGIVYLVGAGPGDPGLLTVRAAELLRTADVVAHDELIAPAILELIAPGAERIAVGRRHGKKPRPDALHPEVLARAHSGKRVVRLKSGDPFVFGRGAEEAEALAAAGIPFEIVPGITAALGAAAYTGIPLTDRRRASSVTITTGHAGFVPDLPAGADATGGTLVLYMSGQTLARSLGDLLAAGRSSETPAAYIASATRPEQRLVLGTIGDLAGRVGEATDGGPALVIVGDVVQLRQKVSWRERRPLAGRRVVVARARPAESQIARDLRRMGAEVSESPQATVPLPIKPDAVVLPSSSAATALLESASPDILAARMVALGPRTAEAARALGATSVICSAKDTVASAIAATLALLSPAPAARGRPAPTPVPSAEPAGSP
jgi:uroporphyrinogen III methyltransferase/synthase